MDPNNIGGYGPQTKGMRGRQKGQEFQKEGLGEEKERESGAVESKRERSGRVGRSRSQRRALLRELRSKTGSELQSSLSMQNVGGLVSIQYVCRVGVCH